MFGMLMSGYQNLPATNIILDVDFTRQASGSTSITDFTGNYTFTKVGNGTPSVTNDATKGLAMNFSSSTPTYFQSNKSLDMSQKYTEVRVVLKSIPGNQTQIAWCTGDYPSQPVGGLAHYSILGNNTNPPEIFAVNDVGTFVRCNTGEIQNSWNDFTIRVNPFTRVITVINNNNNQSFNYNVPQWIGAGQRISIGGSYVGGTAYGAFNGLIQKLTVRQAT